MAKAKKGDLLSCHVCGLIVAVDETCGCASLSEVICCEQPMEKGKMAAKKVRKSAAIQAQPKAAPKKVVKKKAKAKPAKAAKTAAVKKTVSKSKIKAKVAPKKK